eukprot:15442295-Alexandrium_andersonii.AAC.1
MLETTKRRAGRFPVPLRRCADCAELCASTHAPTARRPKAPSAVSSAFWWLPSRPGRVVQEHRRKKGFLA